MNGAEFFDTICKMFDCIEQWHKDGYINVAIKCGTSEWITAFRHVYQRQPKYLLGK